LQKNDKKAHDAADINNGGRYLLLSLSFLHPQRCTRLLLATAPYLATNDDDALYFPKWPAGGMNEKKEKRNSISMISCKTPDVLSRSNGRQVCTPYFRNHLNNIGGMHRSS
jgi:hypothetical protein